MMRKDNQNRSLIKELISGAEGGSKLSVAETKIQDVQDWTLLQLLLNALSSYDSNILKFNNLTGHLYCFHPEWVKRGKEKKEDIVWKIPCTEFRVTRDYCLEMSVRTLTSERLKIRFHLQRGSSKIIRSMLFRRITHCADSFPMKRSRAL